MKITKNTTGRISLQPLLRPQFEFVFSRPLVGVIRGKCEFVMQELVCLGDKTAIVRVLEVDVDVSCQCAVLVADHCRTMGEGDCATCPSGICAPEGVPIRTPRIFSTLSRKSR